MKVLFFSSIIAPYRIGLFNELSRLLDDEIKFYFDSFLEGREWDLDKDSIHFNYETLDSPNIILNSIVSNRTRLNRTIYFPYRVFLKCLKEKPDIILSFEMGWRTIFCIIYAKIFLKKVFILSEVTIHSELMISGLKKIIRKLILMNIDGAIAHGKLSKKYLMGLGLSEKNIIISPDSIDNDFFINESNNYKKNNLRKDFNLSENTFVFLYVGRFIHLKGIDLLIKNIMALKENVNKEDFLVLLVGGNGKEIEKLAGSIDEKLFRIFNFKQGKDLVPFYMVADCMIFPTRQDVWGMVVNEAIACGLPMIVSKYAGCADDLIENGKNGYIFDPLDNNSFIDILYKCMHNKDELNTFAKTAKEKLNIYNHKNAANLIVQFILQRS